MIAIFDARAEEFGTLGLGILEPTSCTTSESDGGLWEISLEQPVTDDMRWALIQQMRIIRAPAPVRESPCVEIGTTTVERRIYKTAVPTKQKLYLRNAPSLEAKRISLHAYGAEVQVLREANNDWSEVITLKGGEHGYMWTRYLEYVRTETETIQADTPSKIIETYQTRDQLFRISSVESDSAERMIRVKGEHITYDLRGVVVAQEYNPENEPANVAVQRLMEYADHETDFTIYCGSSAAITGKYTGRNIIDCLFNPDDGIVKQAGLRVIRDNFEIYLLPEQEREVQAEIRYGHNLLSAALTTDTSNVITRIFPYGTDSKGNEVRGAYVDSPHIDEFPVIMAKAIEYDIKDIKPADAAAKLQELAEAEFGIIRISKLSDWCENLIKTWTDHKSETDAIVNQYITSFNDNTNPVIQALQTKYGDSSAEDVATIRQYQTDVSSLLWARQNGHFTSAEKEWLRNMVVEIDAMSATCDDVGGTSSGLDAASVKLDTDFVRLELSPAYTAVANQYALHMYDVVPVIDEEIGLVAAARMTGYEFDCIMQQYTSTDLGDLEDVSKVYGYELATGSVQGTKLISGTIGGSKLQDATIGYAKINAAAITQLTADSVTAIRATIRELVAQQITTDQLYADLATIAVAQITTANIDNANINWAQIQNLTAEIATVATAEIQSAKISYANVYDLSADTALIRQGAAGDFFFDKLSVSSAQMVDLTVGQLTVKASNGNYYSLDVDLDTGNVTANQVTVTQAEIDAGKTSTGNHIIDTDLTVTELSTSTAKATEALINKLTAQRIDVAELFAQQAFIAALDANMIKASNIQALEGQLNVWANDKIQLAVDNVQVGGRNLITDSETIYLEASTSHFAHKDLYSPLINGQQYTITFGSVVQTAGSAPAYLTLNGYCPTDNTNFRAANVQISSERKSYTFTTPNDGRVYRLILYHGVGGSAVAGNAFTLNNVKLEIGNKATDWTPAPEDTDAAITATRSMITQTRDEIELSVEQVAAGAPNLIRGTNTSTALSATADGTWAKSGWRSAGGGTGTRASIKMVNPPNGNLIRAWHLTMTSSGTTLPNGVAVAQNNVPATAGGVYTISCYAKGTGYLTMAMGRSSYNGSRTHLNGDGTWERVTVTVTLSSGTAYVTENGTHVLFGATGVSDFYICGMKVETGDTATAWTDANQELANSSVKINDEGIEVNTTGYVQIDATDPLNESYINLGSILELNYEGGLTAKKGTFTELSLDGNSVTALPYPVVFSRETPQETGVIWIQPTAAVSAQYSSPSDTSRSTRLHFGNYGTTSASLPAFTFSVVGTDIVSGTGNKTYRLEFDAYSLTDLTSVTLYFEATATKSGQTVRFTASSAVTMKKYQTEHITLTATTQTNLCANTNTIAVTIKATATSGNLTKMYVQSNQTMKLTCAAAASSGQQACNLIFIP